MRFISLKKNKFHLLIYIQLCCVIYYKQIRTLTDQICLEIKKRNLSKIEIASNEVKNISGQNVDRLDSIAFQIDLEKKKSSLLILIGSDKIKRIS